MKGFGTLAASIGVAIIIASIMYAIRSAAGGGGTLYAVGNIGFHGTVVLALAFIVTPPAGSFLTLTVAEGFRRTTRPRTLLRVLTRLRPIYWLLLAASVWFPFHAHQSLRWPAWRIAYVQAAIVGVLFGGLAMLATITTDLRKRLADYESWGGTP